MDLVTKQILSSSILFGTAIFFLGTTYFSFVYWQDKVRIGTESEHWPTEPATFLSGAVTYAGHGTNKDASPYQGKIRYSFLLNGVPQVGDTIAAANYGFGTRSQAEDFINRYPRENLLAHYNPANPAEVVLETGVPFVWHLLLVLPFLTSIVAVFLTYEAIRTLKRSQ